jgi:hypothetical protein
MLQKARNEIAEEFKKLEAPKTTDLKLNTSNN